MGLSPGAKRSLGITAGLLGGLAALGLARDLGGPLGAAGIAARLWVFPHGGLRAPRAFPDRPASLLPGGLALAVALLQWALVGGFLARWTRDRSPRAQAGWALGTVLLVGLAVLLGAGFLGGEISLD
ncbi:MAG TPA: hypothetical protein VJ623_13110 [Holophagaceae bacterium]|nr:hypothetical protein [Holophagaceae bacterium]